MQLSWLNNQNNKELIVFMNGWGMDKKVIDSLNPLQFDILHINDYRDFDFDFSKFDFKKYQKKYLIAWSMGVYCANLYSDIFNCFDKKIAIAGTSKIIDNNFGIPDKIYNCTIKFFSKESKEKFIKNIFLDEKNNVEISKTDEELKSELISIKNLKMTSFIEYDKAIVPQKDIIVPYKNQINYWQNSTVKIVELDTPHYVFNNYKNWWEIIC